MTTVVSLAPSSRTGKTFLQLVNLTRQEAGVANSDLATVEGAVSAETRRFRGWVASAWERLQAMHDEWQFLRQDFQFNTNPGQAFYTAAEVGVVEGTVPILADWKLDSLRISSAGTFGDEAIVGFVTYEQYRNLYLFGRMRDERSKPVAFTVRPSDKALGLGIIPDQAYTVNGEFFRTPQVLTLDNDMPLMPGRYHDLVAYMALRSFGVWSAAPEKVVYAEEMIRPLLAQLSADQLPAMESGPPLA